MEKTSGFPAGRRQKRSGRLKHNFSKVGGGPTAYPKAPLRTALNENKVKRSDARGAARTELSKSAATWRQGRRSPVEKKTKKTAKKKPTKINKHILIHKDNRNEQHKDSVELSEKRADKEMQRELQTATRKERSLHNL